MHTTETLLQRVHQGTDRLRRVILPYGFEQRLDILQCRQRCFAPRQLPGAVPGPADATGHGSRERRVLQQKVDDLRSLHLRLAILPVHLESADRLQDVGPQAGPVASHDVLVGANVGGRHVDDPARHVCALYALAEHQEVVGTQMTHGTGEDSVDLLATADDLGQHLEAIFAASGDRQALSGVLMELVDTPPQDDSAKFQRKNCGLITDQSVEEMRDKLIDLTTSRKDGRVKLQLDMPFYDTEKATAYLDINTGDCAFYHEDSGKYWSYVKYNKDEVLNLLANSDSVKYAKPSNSNSEL